MADTALTWNGLLRISSLIWRFYAQFITKICHKAAFHISLRSLCLRGKIMFCLSHAALTRPAHSLYFPAFVLNMNKQPHVAVVGATGAVGIEMIKTLEKRNFPVGKL